jgi:sugar phosphate isomerase/epimerase
MSRPVTLFTGQWADLTFDTLCQKAKSFGYDGIEIACWGDHFEVDRALSEDGYLRGRWFEVLCYQQPPGWPGCVRPDR